MSNPFKILILGGTRNARDLAVALSSKDKSGKGLDITTSLAGRTTEPETTFGKIRIGGFGGATGLAEYLAEEDVHLLVDATHPFASRISQNALLASKSAGVKRLILNRSEWQIHPGDNWIDCDNLKEAADRLPAGAVAFLALGHQYLDRFAHRDDVKFIARMIDRPEYNMPLPNHRLIIARPSHIASEEADLFRLHNVTHLVSRNSGGRLVYAKIEATRSLQLPVLMIRRPPAPAGDCFTDINDLADEIIRLSA